jgi:trehalose utilization protein
MLPVGVGQADYLAPGHEYFAPAKDETSIRKIIRNRESSDDNGTLFNLFLYL